MPVTTTNTANFNNNDLTQVTGVTILGTDNFNPASRNLTMNEIARRSRSKITSDEYNKKAIGLRVGISRNTRDLVEQSLDSLLALIQEPEKDLLVRQSGGLRKYTCTFADYTIRVSGGSYLEITLIFETSDHFGYDTYPTVLLNATGQTSYARSDLVNIGGSARWQVPVIRVTFTSIADADSRTVQIGNGKTGQVVSISRIWTAGDKLEVDPVNQSVQVNGSDVDFTGALPEFKTGYGYLSYNHNFSSAQYSIYAEQYRRWA